jgi:O-antigen ligase
MTCNDTQKPQTAWLTYLFLLSALYLAQHYDPSYSIKFLNPQEQIENVDYIVDSINKANDWQRRVGLFSLGAFGCASLTRYGKRGFKLNLPLGLVVSAYLALATSSFVWSDDMAMSLRRITALLLVWTAAAGFASMFTASHLLRFAFFSGSLTLLLGVACEIANGTLQLFHTGYRFGGLTHPIGQAINNGMLIISALALAKTHRRYRYVYYAVAATAFGFIVLSGSRGPMVATILSLLWLGRMILKKSQKVAFALGSIIVVCLLLLTFGDKLWDHTVQAVLLDRTGPATETLTGRIPLWQECLHYVWQRPLLGYGYESFWTPDRFVKVANATNFAVADVHNGYLDMALSLGLPGACLGTLAFLLTIAEAMRRYFNSHMTEYAFASALVTLLSLNMLLMTVFPRPMIPSFVAVSLIIKLGFLREDSAMERERP